MAANWKPGNTRKAVSDEERRVAAYKDWLQGASGPMLVEKYGYSDRHAAIRAVRLVQRSLIEDAAEAREQATERLFGPLMAMRSLALEGDAQAAGAYKGLEERLSKLWGLDMPVKSEVDIKGAAGFPILANPNRLPLKAMEAIDEDRAKAEQEHQGEE